MQARRCDGDAHLGQRAPGDEILFLDQGRLVERASAGILFQTAVAQAAAIIKGQLLGSDPKTLLLAVIASLPAAARTNTSSSPRPPRRAVGTLRAHSAGLPEKTDPGGSVALGRGQRSISRGRGDPTWCRCRPGRPREIPRRGHALKRSTSCTTTSLDRAEVDPAKVSGAEHPRRPEKDQVGERAVRIARRQSDEHRRAPICGRGRGDRHRRREKRAVVPRYGPGMGPASTPHRLIERLPSFPTAHRISFKKTGAACHRGRSDKRLFNPVRGDAGNPPSIPT